MKDLTDPEWVCFVTTPERVGIADQISEIYRLVESGDVEASRLAWIQITLEAREKFKRIVLRDPDVERKNHQSVDRIQSALWTVIDLLHRSTNNETLQMHWREVTDALFKAL